MLHKAAPLHLLVLVPAKMKGTQGLGAEDAFIQRQEMSSECMTRPLQMQVRNVLVNILIPDISLLSLVKILHKSLTISPYSKEANLAFALVPLATALKTQDPFTTFRNGSCKFSAF